MRATARAAPSWLNFRQWIVLNSGYSTGLVTFGLAGRLYLEYLLYKRVASLAILRHPQASYSLFLRCVSRESAAKGRIDPVTTA